MEEYQMEQRHFTQQTKRTMAYDINSLIEFLRFPSVSADNQIKPHVEACADWLIQRFKKAGLDAEIYSTGGKSGRFGSK
jgi:acetylornithine deacetylase/succinyl-diaminopimelate desuccinylase-like protein